MMQGELWGAVSLPGTGAMGQQNNRTEEFFMFPFLLCGLDVSPSSMGQGKWRGLQLGSLCGLSTSFPQAAQLGGLVHLHHDGQNGSCPSPLHGACPDAFATDFI